MSGMDNRRAVCSRCHSQIEIKAERHRYRLARVWFEGKSAMWGDKVDFSYVERSKKLVSGTLCKECAEIVRKAIEEAMEVDA